VRRASPLGFLVSLCAALYVTATITSSAAGPASCVDPAVLRRPLARETDAAAPPAISAARVFNASPPIIIDHTCVDLSQIPPYWIEQAKALLRVSYGHTSHGSQPITGMAVLEANTPSGLYDFNTNGSIAVGVLSVADRVPDGDLGNPDRVTWEARTRAYLNGAGSDRNVVVWSWCGQVSSATQTDIQTYLDLMDGLERDYTNVTFVYMTGHLDGGGVEGNLNVRNEQIRQYCRDNGKVLFDFADIESYDPDGDEFLSRYARDDCSYTCGGGTCNWADQWCVAHASDALCDSCSCAHSRPLNCNLKARAFWWMMARIAGWPGAGEAPPQKYPSSPVAYLGDVVTYTVEVRDLSPPPEATVYMTDAVPFGLQYVPHTLDASSGVVDDSSAPTLSWTGVLDPAPVVLVTYAVTVTAGDPLAAVNTATIDAPGFDTDEHPSTLLLNPLAIYLPLGWRSP
jgi:uncharacterized repeat protein (TIGR01451 family)